MAYDFLQTASFAPRAGANAFTADYETLSFPVAWREPILQLYRSTKPDGQREKIQRVPIRRLNAVMRAVLPDVLTVDRTASFDATQPWLYAGAALSDEVLDNLIQAWLWDMNPTPEAYARFRQTVAELDQSRPAWVSKSVDLLAQEVSPGGTSTPASASYRLLPDWVAAAIADLPPYEHCGERISFVRVATDPRDGAELMSWPPLEHSQKTRGGGIRTSYYSAVIRVSLRTIPFDEVPRVHLSLSVRRWTNGSVWLPQGLSASVYLKTQSPFLREADPPARFAVAGLRWSKELRRVAWTHGEPTGLLERLSALKNLPSAELLQKESDAWQQGRDGLTAAVVHHTRMGWHPVRAGLMPAERRRVLEWAAQALEPAFEPMAELHRSQAKPQLPIRQQEKRRSVPKTAADDERAAIADENDAIDARNARSLRTAVSAAVSDEKLTVLMLHQPGAIRERLTAAVEASLDLHDHRVPTDSELACWTAPDLTLDLHFQPLGSLGAPLGEKEKLRTKADHDAALAARRRETAAFVKSLSERHGISPALIIVELEGLDRFTGRTDPKFALRAGCAEAGAVTQFVRPESEAPEDAEFRATAAWLDGLRQVGVRLVPEHSLGTSIPENLNQVALWLVKRRVDGPTNRPQFTPIAVMLRPQENRILARTADMDEWVPYPKLLTSLVGAVRSADLASEEQQIEAVAIFLRKLFYGLKGAPTLFVAHAQNLRSRWPWLQNSGLVPDHLQFGNGPLQRMALHGRHLRLARVATAARDETPQWWAPSEHGAGISKGLWQSPDEDEFRRVFYSTVDKGNHTVGVNVSKLTHHVASNGKSRIDPPAAAWNPGLLELTMACLQPGDDPTAWAMYLHQQRFAEDYRDSLGLPLVLHLAKLTSHYALPYDDEPDDEGVDTSLAAPDTEDGAEADPSES